MAVLVTGRILLDTNVFIDYLRQDLHADWVFGRAGHTVRFLSSSRSARKASAVPRSGGTESPQIAGSVRISAP